MPLDLASDFGLGAGVSLGCRLFGDERFFAGFSRKRLLDRCRLCFFYCGRRWYIFSNQLRQTILFFEDLPAIGNRQIDQLEDEAQQETEQE